MFNSFNSTNNPETAKKLQGSKFHSISQFLRKNLALQDKTFKSRHTNEDNNNIRITQSP